MAQLLCSGVILTRFFCALNLHKIGEIVKFVRY